MQFRVISVVLSLATVIPAMVCAADAESREDFFETKIRPLLAEHCGKCHGEIKATNELRVDSRDALLKGGERGPVIVPGDPDASLLIRAVRYADEELQMPPDEKLPDEAVADLVRWLREGAVWPDTKPASGDVSNGQHWAFTPVKETVPPDDPTGWSASEIDRFVAARLREQRIEPNQPASKRALIRRAYFDLIGLPPSPEQIEAFLADETPDAFATVVERLLDSPQYGERWGRHWMDVARYADTAGDNADYPVPEVHLYRDYIIDAFNDDKPYDEFVREQIAGDFLAADGPPEEYASRVIATGFLALSRRYATAPYELMHLTLEDSIDTVGRAFMGLTLRCARCHDHKFDPITTKDYYALYGIFASTRYPFAGAEEFQSKNTPRLHFVPLVPPAEAQPRMAAYETQLAELEGEIKRTEEPAKSDAALNKQLESVRGRVKALRRAGVPPDLPVAYAVTDGEIIDAHVQLAGDPGQQGDAVPRGVPAFFAGDSPPVFPTSESGRRQLAEWIARPDHPLTARVMVNRIWQHHFGRGIVATPSNFGLSGAEPTHPELLDWLAHKFVAGGWSIKNMHRLIMASKTYQLSSTQNDASAAVDPANAWYWRYDRRRLDAEAIRDTILALSGHLDLDRPGAQPFPPIEKWGWTQHSPFKDVYPSNHRSVYLMTQRLQRHPYLALFDGPDTNTTTDVRSSSTVPLQALFLMNSDFLREESAGFAARLIAAASDPLNRIDLTYALAYGRPPQKLEYERAVQFVRDYERELQRQAAPPENIEQETWLAYARTVFASNEFVYLD